MVFDTISSNIDEVLSINQSANEFAFGDFNIHHKDWLSILVEVIDLVNSVTIFSITNDLTQKVNFPNWIPDYDCHSPGLLDLFISSDASICPAMAFPPLGNSDYFVVSVSNDFPPNSKQDAPFQLMSILKLIRTVFLVLLLLLVNFLRGFGLELM